MCLVVVAWRPGSAAPLVAAGNRDEHHARPTAPAHWWPEGILAGKDLLAGGTWMGISRAGRFAVVTNFRDPAELGRVARSRGELPLRWLRGEDDPAGIYARRSEYGAFNLILGDTSRLWYVGTHGGLHELGPGLYGLSNAALDTPWPKVERLKARANEDLSEAALLAALADRSPASDEDLPDTRVGIELERMLSPAFIATETYGTRSTTVITPGRFVERRFGPGGAPLGETVERW